ncbi:hypothetical protein TNCV_5137111 [Trichonephila clavipes]|nr:hypothetical protein TNCV_5137111 [Trichonephila clavipes]
MAPELALNSLNFVTPPTRGYLIPARVNHHRKFLHDGRVSVEDDEPAGRPMSANTDQNIAKNRDMTGFSLT